MKIQLIQDRLRSGGTERQTVLLARAFAKAGHDVQVLTFRPGGAVASTLAPVPHVVLQPFDLGLDWFAPGLHGAVTRFSPDVILCMGRMANAWAGSVKLKQARRDPRLRVVGTMRTGKPLPKKFRESLLSVDHVVANSFDAAARLLADYAVPSEKISVIHNALVFLADSGTTTEQTQAKRRGSRAENGADEASLVLLCVAMFRPEKNQRALVDVFQKFFGAENAQLWFVGDGPTLAEVQAHARASGVASAVKFFGFQEHPERFYAGADLAVLTSRSESLSNFLIEAHAHGLPSVAYDVMGVKECGGATVPFGDEAAFGEKLRALAADPEARMRESERLRAYAQQAFAPEKQATEYLELFARLR